MRRDYTSRMRDYAMSRRDRARRSRNALGQYTSDRRSRDYRDREREMRDYNRNGRDYYNRYDGRYDGRYDEYEDNPMSRNMDYNNMDYRYRDTMDYAEMDDNYERDLNEWMNKLRKHDKYGMSKDQVLEKAKQFSAKMEDYSEEELYTCYLMMVSDYGHVVSDPMVFIKMAISFLDDEDAELKGSEKLCMYMYSIVLDREI